MKSADGPQQKRAAKRAFMVFNAEGARLGHHGRQGPGDWVLRGSPADCYEKEHTMNLLIAMFCSLPD